MPANSLAVRVARQIAIVLAAMALVTFFAACDDDDDDGGAAETVIATQAAATETAATPQATVPSGGTPATSATQPAAELDVTSDAFEQDGAIPVEHSCEGANTSPQIAWSGAPQGTQSFALIVDDPDAPGGDFVHWVVYDIPATVADLPAGVPEGETIAAGGLQGASGTGSNGYIGSCPPPADDAHRYQFRVYALDVATIGLPAAQAKREVLAAMEGHVLGEGLLVGTFDR